MAGLDLTDEERALLVDYPWPGTPVAAALDKLLQAYDALVARETSFQDPLSDDEIKSLLRAVLAWRAQGSDGSTSHWTTPRSRLLAETIDRLRAAHPKLCAVFGPAALGEQFVQAVNEERAKRPPDAPLTVHLLSEGRALCGKPGPPGAWDSGHRWVSAHNDDLGPRTAANCTECLAAMPEFEP